MVAATWGSSADHQQQAIYVEGLDKARSLLESMVEKIEEYREEDEQMPTPSDTAVGTAKSVTARNAISSQELAAFCERWQVTELRLFGSVLRDDFGPDSDIDVLVNFAGEARHSLFDLVDMEQELKAIFGRKVDLVERTDVERSENYIRRKAVLQSAETIYAA